MMSLPGQAGRGFLMPTPVVLNEAIAPKDRNSIKIRGIEDGAVFADSRCFARYPMAGIVKSVHRYRDRK
jgi:hypothetical protein